MAHVCLVGTYMVHTCLPIHNHIYTGYHMYLVPHYVLRCWYYRYYGIMASLSAPNNFVGADSEACST